MWLAHDEWLGADVALKPTQVVGDGGSDIERLCGESRVLAKLRSHPHVVHLHDLEPVPGPGGTSYWLVMEYVSGGTLERRPPLAPEVAARYGAQIAGALEELHAERVVHCDVKPANVGLTEDGSDAKLLDFGAAYRTEGSQTVTRNGPVAYTPCYAPVELTSRRVPVPRSDVYCLGATLQELVTGRPPCGACEEHETATPRSEDLLGPLHEVVGAMLRERAVDRPSAAEARRLLWIVAETGHAPPVPDGPDLVRDPPHQAPRRSAAQVPGRPTVLPVADMADGKDVTDVTDVTPEEEPGPARRRRGAAVTGGAVFLVSAALVAGWVMDWSWPLGDPSEPRTEPAPSATPDPAQYVSTSPLIVDERTVDPCALTDEEALRDFGETHLDRDYGYFHRCDVLVYPSDDVEVDVQVLLTEGPEAETMELSETVGDVTVMAKPDEPDVCARVVVPPGGDDMSVEVIVEGGDDVDAMCAMADVAARSAAELLETADGPLSRRSPPLPDASLAWQDACALIDEAMLTDKGFDAADLDDEFGGWSCSWPFLDGGWAEVDFNRDFPVSAEDGRPLELSGRQAAVAAEGYGEDTCLVTVEHREHDGEDGGRLAEVLHIAVGGPRSMDELCTDVTDLVASAAAALPPA